MTETSTHGAGVQPLPSRRLKRLIVSWDLARDFIVAGQHDLRYRVIDGVPNDAELVNVRRAWPNCIELLLASASFDELKEGEEIPPITPTFERTYDNSATA